MLILFSFFFNFSAELTELNKKLKLPRTIIAVVGDTGAGKSSLLNALLDHGNILPTSGMRACTAVVVEVQQNLRTNCYEADIDFLSVEVSFFFCLTHICVKTVSTLRMNCLFYKSPKNYRFFLYFFVFFFFSISIQYVFVIKITLITNTELFSYNNYSS